MSEYAQFTIKKMFERFPFNRRRPQSIKTADYTIGIRETGTTFFNTGATGAVVFTLPQNADKGIELKFIVGTAQSLSIDPGAAGAIYLAGSKLSDDTAVSSSGLAASIQLESDGNGDWFATPVTGTWA